MYLLLLLPFLLILAVAATSSSSHALVHRRPTASDSNPTGDLSKEYSTTPTGDLSKDYGLLDIILVASVDGKFHALNRTSGHTLWSMASFATTTSVSAPAALAPLMRTKHSSEEQETYIIEPQSGDIYVMATPSSPLQRFPFSMRELVDISPFTSVNKDDVKMFVGRKETSLVLVELETGRIKATLNSECPFVPNEEVDESVSAPTEVYIGRTDYHISIHKEPVPGKRTPPVRELSFSTYGPNNKDNHLQTMYKRTIDDSYVQSLPNGEIISFRAKRDSDDKKTKKDSGPTSGTPLWGHHFNTPIIRRPPLPLAPLPPFVLLQPTPHLTDLFPTASLTRPLLPNLDSAYVGLLDESGSLYVMTPERFPLVVFGGSSGGKEGHVGTRLRERLLDGPRVGGRYNDREEEEEGEEEDETDPCMRNPYDTYCLTGVRRVDSSGVPDSRLKRLLDGVPSVPGPPSLSNRGAVVVGVGRNEVFTPGNENTSGGGVNRDRLAIGDGRPETEMAGGWGQGWEAWVVTMVFGVVSVWFLWRRVGGKVGRRWREGVQALKREERAGSSLGVNVDGPHENGSAQEQGVLVDGNANADVDIDSMPYSKTKNSNGLHIPLPSTPLTPSTPLPSLDKPLPSTPTQPQPPFSPSTPSTAVPSTPATATPKDDDADDTDPEAEEGGSGAPATPGKRKPRRGKRGKKKKTVVVDEDVEGAKRGEKGGETGRGEEQKEYGKGVEEGKEGSLVLTSSSAEVMMADTPSLVVSDTILGFGSHGTVVFRGSLQGRAVAVKRLLRDFVTLAQREITILQQSDSHPNVIRYYYHQSQLNFLYIALELCPASLADLIESPEKEAWREVAMAVAGRPGRALGQVARGVRFLHGLGLVHRDIKPQNILVSSAGLGGGGAGYRMLISDFGLCKKLDGDQTSFLPTAHGAMAAGTVGWRAPEILRGEVKLDAEMDDKDSLSSRGSVATVNGSSSSGGGTGTGTAGGGRRLTKSVDIFALGCLFYYTLTGGGHPYGDRFEREVNILRDAKSLEGLEFGEEGMEARDLIGKMISFEASGRPDTTTILLHPFFWDPLRRLNFLQDASDRFEIMSRDPRDPHLLALENEAQSVVGNDWHARLDRVFIENLGKYRKYDGRSVQDLMRALRNKKHHYQDLPDNVKRHLGLMPEGFLGYFTRRYPHLFLHVHGVIRETGLYSESMFRTYFELPDT
ncbi:hypothetical protein B0H34DRAFT_800449 [Crassisporium funariophilum]|nr:hypothetical protein B0H34DRAFT_800449 [Crassisporium funariophilum]